MPYLAANEISSILKSGYQIGPVTISLVEKEPRPKFDSDKFRADYLLNVSTEEGSFTFVAKAKCSSSKAAVNEACIQALSFPVAYDASPIVVMPYLDEQQLMDIYKFHELVSAIDLCGNALIRVPGKMFVYCSGKPNKYPDSRPIKKIYQGDSALVCRAMLQCPLYKTVSGIQEQIIKNDAHFSLSAVSKVLTQLKEDLIVTNRDGAIRLSDWRNLLDNLARNYSGPKITAERKLKLKIKERDAGTSFDLIPGELAAHATKLHAMVCLTGASSITNYGVGVTEPLRSFYFTGRTDDLLKNLSIYDEVEWVEDEFFPNVRILETQDQTVFYDKRGNFASPVQTYLELKNGDKRQQDGAAQVKQYIKNELEDRLEELSEDG